MLFCRILCIRRLYYDKDTHQTHAFYTLCSTHFIVTIRRMLLQNNYGLLTKMEGSELTTAENSYQNSSSCEDKFGGEREQRLTLTYLSYAIYTECCVQVARGSSHFTYWQTKQNFYGLGHRAKLKQPHIFRFNDGSRATIDAEPSTNVFGVFARRAHAQPQATRNTRIR